MRLPFAQTRPLVQMRMTRQLLPDRAIIPLPARRQDFRSKSVISVAMLLFRGQRSCELVMLGVFCRSYVVSISGRMAAILYPFSDWVRIQIREG